VAKGQQEKAAMKKVDLNEENAAAEKTAEDAVEEPAATTVEREGDNSRQVATEMAQESVLDKYLNHDVLTKK